MTPAKFKELCAAVRRTWTRSGGAVAILTTPGGKKTLRLVAGVEANKGLVPAVCTLWRGDEPVYTGPLESEDLKKELTAAHVARARVTTASKLGPARSEMLSLTPDRKPPNAERLPV